ncbi:MAG: zinc-binding protein [Chloroflexi bacterium]|nr:MAG: zinc-binding protein [Chloroflexota bacterium]
MDYEDKTLRCSDCGNDFIFSASEQDFFHSKGFVNEPGRCPDCRAIRKRQRPGGYGGGYTRQRQMYPAVCASCGKDCEVPFEPRDGRPVYCSDCYSTQRQ